MAARLAERAMLALGRRLAEQVVRPALGGSMSTGRCRLATVPADRRAAAVGEQGAAGEEFDQVRGRHPAGRPAPSCRAGAKARKVFGKARQ